MKIFWSFENILFLGKYFDCLKIFLNIKATEIRRLTGGRRWTPSYCRRPTGSSAARADEEEEEQNILKIF